MEKLKTKLYFFIIKFISVIRIFIDSYEIVSKINI